MFKVKVRGIYSTALTRLLIDHGFRIVQPSATIRERFRIKDFIDLQETPDLDIHDRRDRQGVYAAGSFSILRILASILKSELYDVVLRGRIHVLREISRSTQYPKSRASNDGAVEAVLNIEFPSLSKRKLDSIRRTVTPTLDGHHYYRACGGRIASLLEMAERLLREGCPQEEVEKLFKETIRPEYPHVGSIIQIEHVKIDGRYFYLGSPKIMKFDEEKGILRLHRTFMKKGVYDGLKVRKDPGDYAITDLKVGSWSLKTRYFSSEGVYKGTYINLNTPIELYPRKIRYVDLEVDICVWPDGRIVEIDMDKLQDKVYMGCISEKIESIVREKVNEIMNTTSLELEKDEQIIHISSYP